MKMRDLINLIEKENTLHLPDIEVGDQVMVGKFKNRRATVKGFSKDDHNQPVLKTDKGDQKLFKPRISKLQENEDQSPAERCYDAIEHGLIGMQVTTDYNVKNDTTIDIGWIGAVNPGSGQGTKAMNVILKAADHFGVVLTLEVADDEDDEESEGEWIDDDSDSHASDIMNAHALQTWYARMGFEFVGHDGWRAQMRREPNSRA